MPLRYLASRRRAVVVSEHRQLLSREHGENGEQRTVFRPFMLC